jgi:hypothetical protein
MPPSNTRDGWFHEAEHLTASRLVFQRPWDRLSAGTGQVIVAYPRPNAFAEQRNALESNRN